MKVHFRSDIRNGKAGMWALSLLFLAIFIYSNLCTIPTSNLHISASETSHGHRSTIYGCFLEFNISSTDADVLEEVSFLEVVPILTPPDIFPRVLNPIAEIGGHPFLRVETPVQQRVLLLI